MEKHEELPTETEDIMIIEDSYTISTNNNLPEIKLPGKKTYFMDLETAIMDNSYNKLGELDKKLRALLLNPQLRRLICSSIKFGCVSEILIIASMETEFTLSYRMARRDKELDKAIAKFNVVESDFLSLLSCYCAWKCSKFSKNWCKNIGLDFTIMQNVEKLREQIEQVLISLEIKNSSCGNHWLSILKCVSHCYANQAAKLDKVGDRYVCCRTGEPKFVHPNSAVNQLGRKPAFVVFHKIVTSTKGAYMRGITIIDHQWCPSPEKTFSKPKNPEEKIRSLPKTVKLLIQIKQVS